MAQLINLVFTPKFKKQYQKLPQNIQQKFTKQLKLLAENYRHHSLRTRKMAGIDKFEARIDLHYRFTFEATQGSIIFITIGSHDTGLGKK